MHIEPSDIDKFVQAVVNGMVRGATRLSEIVYEWYRKQQAPYYIPPPEVRNYEDQPEAVYPVENEVYRNAEDHQPAE